ncbi:hypothetical protein K439DRAFT_1081471 [Ramaria rubella]|nr:hypothetical protein K439DRAFT_1081471 [Ramaria rubella]
MASITAPVSQDASSLRAAALLTIRSKARPRYQSSGEDRPPQDHLDDASSVASTRRIAPSPELNYGSDDGLADAEGSTEEEEEGEKEEGEISDDDVTPAKTSPITMDVDNEPLPGLASSSSRTWYLEDTSGLQSKNHLRTSPVPPSTYPSTKPASRIFEQPHTTTSFTGTLDTTPLSTVPTGSGDHALNQSPVLKRPASPRNPPASSKSSAPSSHLPNASFSRFLSPQAETDRHGSDSAAEQAKVTGLSSHPSSSRQVTSKFDVPSTDTTLIRPSLNMTVEDFMEAKTIILDLLGWGVPSEYFIHCGLTREAIFYAFTEMNLKLPTNLNIQGIIPYEPPADYVSDSLATTDDDQAKKTALLSIQPTEKTNALNSATNSVQTDRRASGSGHVKLGIISTASPHPLPPRPASIATPPLTSITSSISSGDVGNTQPQPLRSSQGGGHLDASSNQSYHDSSSPNDPIPGLQAEFSRSTIPPKSTRSSSYSMGDAPLHGYSGNLDEIETLRRQELQARKAVLASRKPKLGAYNSVVKSAAGVVPSSLNVEISGTDSPSTGSPPRSLLGVSGQRVPIPADTVDEFLKSIASGPSASDTGDDSGLIPALTRSPDSMDIDVDPSPHDGPADAHTPFSTGASTVDSQSALEQQPPFSSRKSSMKRPVASDFVDYDSISRESPFASSTSPNVPSNGWGKGSLSSTPSFANLLPTRKIIIDFSDSEEEDTVEASNALISEEQRCLPASIAMHILAPASTGSTNAINTPASLPSTPVPTLSATGIPPEALLLKEQEIKRMKELIAEREKNRLKKLANLPKSVTPPPHPRSSSTAILEIASKPVNEEITSATAENYDGMIIAPTTAARESSTTSVAGDILEENAVMHDIFAAGPSYYVFHLPFHIQRTFRCLSTGHIHNVHSTFHWFLTLSPP